MGTLGGVLFRMEAPGGSLDQPVIGGHGHATPLFTSIPVFIKKIIEKPSHEIAPLGGYLSPWA